MIYRGTVLRVIGDIAYVNIPKRGIDTTYACIIYTPASPALAAGNKVLVSEVGGVADDLVVIARQA